MNFNPIQISEMLDKFASYIESSEELTPQERKKFALRLDQINDEFEKVAYNEGLTTKNGKWLLGDDDEDRYMKRYDETGAYESDEDEKRYMGKFNNPIEERPVAERHEPPVKDLNRKQEGWKNPKEDSSLEPGNLEYGKLPDKKAYQIPKRKI